MEIIRYQIGVKLHQPKTRNLSYEKEHNAGTFFPFTMVEVSIEEECLCPFCGKPMENFSCKCEEFQAKIKKLKTSLGDTQQKSVLHRSIFDCLAVTERPIACVKYEEVENLGTDFWDYSTPFFDNLTKRGFLVSNASYDENEHTILFYCKDLKSKVVYLCKMDNIVYEPKKVYFGILEEKTISDGGNTLGNYHFEDEWVDFGEYESWQAFCDMIKNL